MHLDTMLTHGRPRRLPGKPGCGEAIAARGVLLPTPAPGHGVNVTVNVDVFLSPWLTPWALTVCG